MTRVASLSTALIGVLCVLFVLVGISQPVPHPETYLAVTDKPYVEMAAEAATVAEEWEAKQEETYLYEQSYGVETYNSYWYESDDEDAEAAAKEWIAWRESGGDYDARNGQYIGRYQLSADKLDGDWSEEHQEEVAEAYVADRYGSWQAAQDFWKSHGWY